MLQVRRDMLSRVARRLKLSSMVGGRLDFYCRVLHSTGFLLAATRNVMLMLMMQ